MTELLKNKQITILYLSAKSAKKAIDDLTSGKMTRLISDQHNQITHI